MHCNAGLIFSATSIPSQSENSSGQDNSLRRSASLCNMQKVPQVEACHVEPKISKTQIHISELSRIFSSLPAKEAVLVPINSRDIVDVNFHLKDAYFQLIPYSGLPNQSLSMTAVVDDDLDRFFGIEHHLAVWESGRYQQNSFVYMLYTSRGSVPMYIKIPVMGRFSKATRIRRYIKLCVLYSYQGHLKIERIPVTTEGENLNFATSRYPIEINENPKVLFLCRDVNA